MNVVMACALRNGESVSFAFLVEDDGPVLNRLFVRFIGQVDKESAVFVLRKDRTVTLACAEGRATAVVSSIFSFG